MTHERESQESLTVLALYGENVKRVRAVKILPPRVGVVKVTGRNDSGKSSTLDLIQLALGGGRAQPDVPIRRGATSARDVLELQDAAGQPAIRVTRRWTGKDSYLTVERIGGPPVKSPQEFLDALCGAGLGFDPLAFSRLKPAEQAAALLDALRLSEDPREIDMQQAAVSERRTILNREAKSLKARVDALPADLGADVPDAEVSVAALVRDRDTLIAQGLAKDAAIRAADEKHRDVDRLRTILDNAKQKAQRLMGELNDAEDAVTSAVTSLTKAARAAEEAVATIATMPRPDMTEITRQIETAEETNQAVRAKLERRRLLAELVEKELDANGLTAMIGGLGEKRQALLAGAAFPIPELGFEVVGGAYRVTLRGVPLAQASRSEQIRVGVALAMAVNPTVRVILLRDGSLLDADSLVELERLAGDRGYQVWCEIVGTDGEPGAFVIEDGGVRQAPA